MYLSDSERLHSTDNYSRQITASAYFIDSDIQPPFPSSRSTCTLLFSSLPPFFPKFKSSDVEFYGRSASHTLSHVQPNATVSGHFTDVVIKLQSAFSCDVTPWIRIASRPGRFTAKERAPSTNCRGGCMGPRAPKNNRTSIPM